MCINAIPSTEQILYLICTFRIEKLDRIVLTKKNVAMLLSKKNHAHPLFPIQILATIKFNDVH